MDGAELKAWREARGLTQLAAATAQKVAERTWQNYETGKRPIPADLAATLQGRAIAKPAPPVTLPAVVLARTLDAPAAQVIEPDAPYDPVAAGLKPYPRSNTQWGASINFDNRKVSSPWQRVPKCARVVHESIPNPIPFYPPAWAGWRGVPTADGRVFDYETGHEMRQAARKEREAAAYGSRLKGAGGKAKR